jgi:hypothetical protein
MTAVLDGRFHEALAVLRMPLADHRPDDGGREGIADGDRWTSSQVTVRHPCDPQAESGRRGVGRKMTEGAVALQHGLAHGEPVASGWKQWSMTESRLTPASSATAPAAADSDPRAAGPPGRP